MRDYVIRNVPENVQEQITRVARERGITDEQAALELIVAALGIDVEFEYYDLELLEEVVGA